MILPIISPNLFISPLKNDEVFCQLDIYLDTKFERGVSYWTARKYFGVGGGSNLNETGKFCPGWPRTEAIWS